MDYNFVAQINNSIYRHFFYQQVTNAGVSTWEQLDPFPLHVVQFVQHYFVIYNLQFGDIFLCIMPKERALQENDY